MNPPSRRENIAVIVLSVMVIITVGWTIGFTAALIYALLTGQAPL